ncbi:MAG TPA: VWA domain-containing protein [Candidatus Angelobacter sp.]|nr:VWA domain-containing protein [Candidatus Angelobacter sp.]
MHTRPGYRLLFCLLLSFAITLVANQNAAAQAQTAQEAGATTITVTVTDHDHHPVTGLKAEDFTLYENGQRQPISSVSSADTPACIGLVVDRSGSMRGKHAAIASTMREFAQAGNPDNQIFVVLFSDDPTLEQNFTRDAALIERSIARANARGGTAMYDAIIASVGHLAENKRCGKRVLLIVGDGVDNESRKSLEDTLHALQTAGNPLVYAIVLPHPNGPSTRRQRALEALTAQNGGTTLFAGDSDDMRKIALKIAEEIRSQYGVSYARAKTGHPNVKVEARAPDQKDLTVRVNVPVR